MLSTISKTVCSQCMTTRNSVSKLPILVLVDSKPVSERENDASSVRLGQPVVPPQMWEFCHSSVLLEKKREEMKRAGICGIYFLKHFCFPRLLNSVISAGPFLKHHPHWKLPCCETHKPHFSDTNWKMEKDIPSYHVWKIPQKLWHQRLWHPRLWQPNS